MINNIEELKQAFPLFELYTERSRSGMLFGLRTSYSSIQYLTFPVDPRIETSLRESHEREVLKREVMAKYPYLYVSIDRTPEGRLVVSSLWVRRGDRDAEAISYRHLNGFDDEDVLAHWNEEARKAVQPNWFFCSGHMQAEPKSEYAYFYFAGSYCKAWKAAHPDHYRMAMSESYN